MTFIFVFLMLLSGGVDCFSQKKTTLKTVVIDAGHGGKDPGALGKVVREKDVVLAVALKLGNYINKYLPDVKVVYTRKADVFVPLDQRAKIANENNADLFISIHANYISNPRIVGTETFALGLHRTEENLEVAKKENSVITYEKDYSVKYEGFDPNVSESYIIFELMQNIYLDQSLEMALTVQEQFAERVGRRNRGVKQAGFLVLRETTMPSILIELGFLSNRTEEKYLSSSEGQSLLASGIFRAFRDYKNDFESKSMAMAQNVSVATDESVNVEKDPTPKIIYRIQVGVSDKKVAPGTGLYNHHDDLFEYIDGKMYKYTVENSSNYSDIIKKYKLLRKEVSDCFIVAFEDGKRISIKEARAKQKKN